MWPPPRIVGIRREGEFPHPTWLVTLEGGLVLSVTTSRLYSYKKFSIAALDRGVLLAPMRQSDWHRTLYEAFKLYVTPKGEPAR